MTPATIIKDFYGSCGKPETRTFSEGEYLNPVAGVKRIVTDPYETEVVLTPTQIRGDPLRSKPTRGTRPPVVRITGQAQVFLTAPTTVILRSSTTPTSSLMYKLKPGTPESERTGWISVVHTDTQGE